MPVSLDWREVSIRLLLAIVAGGLIGANRSAHGQPAGMRTMLLVSLAAAVAMIQANLLLGTAGRPHDSFIMLDLMRLPLGILTGMGFIGAGAIFRHGDLVRGVTTAATLWLVTVLGLCFGGGQIALGLAALALCMVFLSGLKGIEMRIRRDHTGTLILATQSSTRSEQEVRGVIEADGFTINSWAVTYADNRQRRTINCLLRWRALPGDTRLPAMVERLSAHPDVLKIQWKPSPVS